MASPSRDESKDGSTEGLGFPDLGDANLGPQHPLPAVLAADVAVALSAVTVESVTRVLAHVVGPRKGLKCRSVTPLGGGGVVNLVYIVEAVPVDAEGDVASCELVLRVTNPHGLWAGHKTAHELAVMRLVAKHTTIPLAPIVDASCDAATSAMGCEYILMERVAGITLQEHLSTHATPPTCGIMRGYVSQLIDFTSQLQRIPLDTAVWGTAGDSAAQYICSLSSDSKPASLLQDGPRCGPFRTFSSFLLANLAWVQREVTTPEKRDAYVLGWSEPLHALAAWVKDSLVLPAAARLDDESVRFCLCHADLNPTNILVNPETGKVVAVLDWEKAMITEPGAEADGLCWVADYFLQLYGSEDAVAATKAWRDDTEAAATALRSAAAEAPPKQPLPDFGAHAPRDDAAPVLRLSEAGGEGEGGAEGAGEGGGKGDGGGGGEEEESKGTTAAEHGVEAAPRWPDAAPSVAQAWWLLTRAGRTKPRYAALRAEVRDASLSLVYALFWVSTWFGKTAGAGATDEFMARYVEYEGFGSALPDMEGGRGLSRTACRLGVPFPALSLPARLPPLSEGQVKAAGVSVATEEALARRADSEVAAEAASASGTTGDGEEAAASAGAAPAS